MFNNINFPDTYFPLDLIIIFTYIIYRLFKSIQLKRELSSDNQENYLTSIIDPTTKLYNKDYLLNSFSDMLQKNPAIFTDSVCVFIDIDDFKRFNETHNREAGDKALNELGKIICKSKRKGDFAFRYSGQEFVIFYMNSKKELINEKLNSIRNLFKEFTSNKHSSEYPCTLSIGVTEYIYSEGLTDIVHRASKAMYIAKYSGKDKIKGI